MPRIRRRAMATVLVVVALQVLRRLMRPVSRRFHERLFYAPQKPQVLQILALEMVIQLRACRSQPSALTPDTQLIYCVANLTENCNEHRLPVPGAPEQKRFADQPANQLSSQVCRPIIQITGALAHFAP